MAEVKPAGLRLVEEAWSTFVPSPAHDALTPAARREYLSTNPHSYLAVTRGAEDLLPGENFSNEELLADGRRALDKLLEEGAFSQVNTSRFYLYQLETFDHVQTAIVGNVATNDFTDGHVRLHEHVQMDRATHLSRHLDVVAAQSSPIALAYRPSAELDTLVQQILDRQPDLAFTGVDGVTQKVWTIHEEAVSSQIEDVLAPMTLYLIDGHHRAAAARAHQQVIGDEPSNHILCAIFSGDQLRNRSHHRVLALGTETADFLTRLQEYLPVRIVTTRAECENRNPDEIALWAREKCYLVTVPFSAEPCEDGKEANLSVAERLDNLDPVRLQRGIIGPLLGVDGSWSGEQLTYRPGIKSVEDLRAISEDRDEVLCVMRPVLVDDLLDASDEGLIMPPKSTYFEPKARSGVFVRHLS